jgi:hypothetical protein
MKKYLFLFISFSLISVSCARQIKDMNVDMTTKGILGAKIIIEEDATLSVFRADTLFFKRLDSATNFKEGSIIMSKVVDSDGNIVINAEPGIYVIIAARYFSAGSWIISVFDEKEMKHSLVELKAGETRIIPETYTIAKNGNFLGTPSDIQKLHREILGEKVGYTMHLYVLGTLNPNKYPDKEEQKKIEENKKEEAKGVEEFK